MEKCSLPELGLPPTTVGSISQMICRKAMMDEQTRQEPITIFYDGHVYVFDVMELQIRAIILVATREMEAGIISNKSSKEAISLALQSRITGPPCNSVKKSLLAFLQNRKNEASAPYSLSGSS